ncbi:MAG TPA: CGGC domain-containing protein [Spirochaetales bacterium]|nr:CGGC domain-containing protein [Spirochaetales bacterium]
MAERIGIIICDRYHNCAGGKCFRAFRERVGAFSVYQGKDAEIAAFTNCGGCPGGNIEYTGDEMLKNGITTVHLATCHLVGYPPCTRTDYFARYLKERFGLSVIIGSHPIPEKYHSMHTKLGSWNGPGWDARLAPAMASPELRSAYN